nr:hypothetical protein [Tanacetum cinerariifolium]
METDEICERYIAPCFVNGLEAYDERKKLFKKELIVALNGELYFVKFIINHKEDDFKPGFILGSSFLRLTHGVVDFVNEVITIHPEPDLFDDNSKKIRNSLDDRDQLLDFNFDDVPKFREELPPFVCKMRKSNRNKKRVKENLNLFYLDIGRSSSAGGHLTHEEAEKEALAIRISQKDKVELDGKTVKEEEKAVKRIKGESLKEKDDPGAFIFPIRLEGKVNEKALTNTGSDINNMPYRIYETLGREEMKKIDRGITMINHTQEEVVGKLSNVLCQVGKKAVSFLGSLPVPLKQVNWKPDYKGSYTKEEKETGQWHTEIRLNEDVVRSLSALVYYRDLDSTTLRDLIKSEGKLIPKDPQPGVPRVGIPRPLRASMQDLYNRMGRMEILQDTIERVEYRQSYHWDRYHGVFEHMAGVYSVPLQGAYKPSSDTQPEELPPFVCKMRKSNRNKKRVKENLNLFYLDIGPSSPAGGHLTQEEAEKEALAIRISQKFALLEKERLVIETMAYNDKYKKILDDIWRDKVELDGKTMKEEEKAVKRIKGESLKEKDDPGAFIFPIRLEGKVNEKALTDTWSDINTMPY